MQRRFEFILPMAEEDAGHFLLAINRMEIFIGGCVLFLLLLGWNHRESEP
jgi:hypothetical protein